MKASNGEWKARLAGRMPPPLAAELDIFENEIALKKQGKATAAVDREFAEAWRGADTKISGVRHR